MHFAGIISNLAWSLVQEKQKTDSKSLEIAGNGSDFNIWPAFLNMLFILGIILLLVVMFIWVYRKFSGLGQTMGGNKMMRIEGTLPLGDRRFIAVVRVAARYYLIGITPQSITQLSEINSEEINSIINENTTTEKTTFAQFLARFRGEDK